MQIKSIINKLKPGITQLDIIIFIRQLATLFSAGIPILKCWEILEKSQNKKDFRVLIYTIKQEITAGKFLHVCLRKYPQYFNELSCHLIQIGENTGKLNIMLMTLANHLEKQEAFKNKIKQILFYPCLITSTGIIITLSMFIFIIPRFAELFHDTSHQLPMLTIFIFYLSTLLRQHFLILTLIFSSLLAMALHLKNHFPLQKWLHFIPPLQHVMQKVILIRFSRNLSITLSSGIPITKALALTKNQCHYTSFASILDQLHNKISSGLRLHQVMETISFFPLLLTQMVKIGEESGMLVQMLEKSADILETDVNRSINRFSQLLEPLIMGILGALIGGLVIGMYLPIFKLGSTL